MNFNQNQTLVACRAYARKNWLPLLAVCLLAWNLVMLHNIAACVARGNARVANLEEAATMAMQTAVRRAMDEQVLELAQAACDARESKALGRGAKSAKQKRG